MLGTCYNFLKAATIDPGFIPVPVKEPRAKRFEARFKNYLVQGGSIGNNLNLVTLQFCAICSIYKPPRTVHCEECNLCVAVKDHHCDLIQNCIGQRNFKNYFWFLVFLSLNSAHSLAQNLADVFDRSANGQAFVEDSLQVPRTFGALFLAIPLSAVCFIVAVIAVVANFGRARKNLTKREVEDKSLEIYLANPFDLGCSSANFNSLVNREATRPLY